MIRQEITFKQVLADDGTFKYLEVWQGDNHIEISLGNIFGAGDHSYVWSRLRDSIDGLQAAIQEAASKSILDRKVEK